MGFLTTGPLRLPTKKYAYAIPKTYLLGTWNYSSVEHASGDPSWATRIWVTSVSMSQDPGNGSQVRVFARRLEGASGGVTCCTPPLRPPSLPCWGSFADRRPGTRFAEMRAPTWTGCDASSCWGAQSRHHRTAQAPGSVGWTLERETAADPDCFCLWYFQNSGLSGWILKKEKGVDLIGSIPSLGRQTDKQKHVYSSPLSFAACVIICEDTKGRLQIGPSWPTSVHATKATPFLSLKELKGGQALFYKSNLLLLFPVGSLASDMKQPSVSWTLISWCQGDELNQVSGLEGNSSKYNLQLDKQLSPPLLSPHMP